jgi:DNA-binding Lrp family transcriptional regulator
MDRQKKILALLRKDTDGLTIQEIARAIKLSRNTVPVILAELKGANKIRVRPVGKAKLHYIKKR